MSIASMQPITTLSFSVERVAPNGRANRKGNATPGIVLPDQRRPVPRPAIAVDTSGSVDDQLLARALGEVDGVLRALGVGDTATRIYSIDAAVHLVQQVRMARDVKLAGGGTDPRPGPGAAASAATRRRHGALRRVHPVAVKSAARIRSRHRAARMAGRHPAPTPPWTARIECRLE